MSGFLKRVIGSSAGPATAAAGSLGDAFWLGRAGRLQGIQSADPMRFVVSALTDARSVCGESPLTIEQVAIGLAVAQGNFVFRPEGDRWTDALLVPIVAGTAHGAQVHVVARSETEALTLRYRWDAQLNHLGISRAVIVDEDDAATRRRNHTSAVVFGSFEQFCHDFVRGHSVSLPESYASSRQQLAVFTDGAGVLVQEAVTRCTSWYAEKTQDEVIRIGILVRTYFSTYDTLSGYLAGAQAFSEILRAWYGAATVDAVPGSGGSGAIDGRTVRQFEQIYALASRDEQGTLQFFRLVDRAMKGKSLRAVLLRIFDAAIEEALTSGSPTQAAEEIRDLYEQPTPQPVPALPKAERAIRDQLRAEMRRLLAERETELGQEALDVFQRRILVAVSLREWTAHLQRLEGQYPTDTLGSLAIKPTTSAEYRDFSAASRRVGAHEASRSIIHLVLVADFARVQAETQLWLRSTPSER